MRNVIVGAASFILPLMVVWGGISGKAWAQEPKIDLYRLIRFYGQLLVAEPEQKDVVEQQIIDEQVRIRALIEEELQPLVRMEEEGDILDVERALDRQRTVVSSLKERLQERRIDLRLLEKEEPIYREGAVAEEIGVGVRLTKSYPELLAQKAVLEERIDLLTRLLVPQEERLEQLQQRERIQNMRLLVDILWYILLVMVVFWVEWFIRIQVLMRIPQRMIRYVFTKIFAVIVYVTLLFWLIQEIFSRYPVVLGAFAIVGAATVIAFQDIIKGIIGWLMQRGELSLGQRVTIGNITGDVLDIGVLHTTLLIARSPETQDVSRIGKMARVPNVGLLSQPLINYHSPSDYALVECSLLMKDVSRWKEVKKILEEVVREETQAFAERAEWQMHRRMREFFVTHESRLHGVVFTEFSREGMLFTLSFPAPLGQRRFVMSRVVEKILQRCEEARISLAFSSAATSE